MATVDGQQTLEALLCKSNAAFDSILFCCVFISDIKLANLPCYPAISPFFVLCGKFFSIRCNIYLLDFILCFLFVCLFKVCS